MLDAHPRQGCSRAPDLRLRAAGRRSDRDELQRDSSPRRASSGSGSSSAPAGSVPTTCAAISNWPGQLGRRHWCGRCSTTDHRPTSSRGRRVCCGGRCPPTRRGVTLALETYEQVPTARPGRPRRRRSAPAASASASTRPTASPRLERPRDASTAPRRTCELHVKDFAFTRQAGWVGFTYRLPARRGAARLRPHRRARPTRRARINQIIEHWLPWQGDAETTCAMEDHGPTQPIDYLRSNSHDRDTKPLTIAVDRRRRQDGHAGLQQPRQAATTRVLYVENSPAGQQRTRDAGREVTDTHDGRRATPTSSSSPCPTSRSAGHRRRRAAAEAGHGRAHPRPGRRLREPAPPTATTSHYAVAHPCHPSVFLRAHDRGGVGRHLRRHRRSPGRRRRLRERRRPTHKRDRPRASSARCTRRSRRALGHRQAARRSSSRPWSRPSPA